MNYWNQIPLFRLIIPFIVGVLSSIFLSFPTPTYIVIAVCVLLLFSVFFKKYSQRWVFGFLSYFLFFLSGVLIIQSQHYIDKPTYFTNYDSDYFEVKLLENVVEKPNSLKSEVEVLYCYVDSEKTETVGKAIIYFKRDSLSEKLKYGDHILIRNKWEIVMEPTNPSQFNYKNFLKNKGIFHQTYLTSNNWLPTSINTGLNIKTQSLSYREQALQLLKDNNFSDEVLSVSSALLLGDKDLLDRETVLMYSSSGAMHVLAVSGLHVGIIFLAFSYFLFFLDKFKNGKYLKAILLILVLWGYALFTGMSSSVLRASTMFSFVIIGGVLNRKTNIYNTLAASAFLLMIINPLIIMQVGFQLSYIAVIGIVYLQPKIYKLYYFKNWLLDKVWVISSVSVAAQLATFPLGMYYFHQYPNYFLLSNLFVIPLATIILNVALLMFVTSLIPFVSSFLATVVRYLVELLNSSVRWVDQLPYSLNLGIDISFMETILIYIFLIILLTSIVNKKWKKIQFSIFLMIVFMSFQIKEMKDCEKQKKMIIYDVPKATSIDFVDGTKCYFIATDWIAEDKSKMRFNISHNRWELNIGNVTRISTSFEDDNFKFENNFLQFYDLKMYFLEESNYKNNTNKGSVNYLVVEKGSSENLSSFLNAYTVDLIVFSTLLNQYEKKKMKNICKGLNVVFHDVKVDGSYQFILN